MGRFFIILLSIFCTGCAAIGRPTANPTIILWHSWQDEQQAQLVEVITRFESIFDHYSVVVAYVPVNDVPTRYQEAVSQGLGPDILLTSNELLRTLVASSTVRAIPLDTIDTSTYYPNAVASVTVSDMIYGVPFAMNPQVLFYRANDVESPATTLDELLRDADSGLGVAINSRFRQALWGISAYGGQLLDIDGRVVLNEGGLVNWFNWLQNAQLSAGIVLSRDVETLQNLFVRGQVAYYVGKANELETLRAEASTSDIQVVPLPTGPNGRAGSLLTVDTLVFNPASSVSQYEASLQLARFLTNTEQSTTFMRDLGLVPANRRVRVDSRAFPAVAAMVTQARNDLPIINEEQTELLLAAGDDVLIRVLEGLLPPATAADEITLTVNDAFGFETANVDTECDLTGALTVWHSWSDAALTWLAISENRFDSACRDATVEISVLPARDIRDAYLEAFADGSAPDVLIAPSRALVDLVEAEAVLPLSGDDLQPYLEVAQNTVRYQDVFYARPLTIETQALYINRNQVQNAPATYDDWLSQLQQGTTAIFPEQFTQTAWGWSAFDALAIDDFEQLTISPEGAQAWFTWFSTADSLQTVSTSNSQFRRVQQFTSGEAAYLVGSTTLLDEIAEEMGDEFQVVLFPSGIAGESRPLLTSRAAFFNPNMDSETLALAKGFVDFLNTNEEQERLVTQTNWLSANAATADFVNDDPARAEMLLQARNGFILQETNDNRLFVNSINTVINQLLADRITPEDAAAEFLPEESDPQS